jgi:TonB-dependent SusC/RagA subfamily outer membrane receptor
MMVKSATHLLEAETMRIPGNRALRSLGLTLGGTLAVLMLPACRPLSPRPEPPAPHAVSSSDASLAQEESHQAYSRIEELIEGRAPGVQVLRRGDGTFSLRIRGVTSPAGHNDPLIVIDGASTGDGWSTNTLASVNPQDVLKIEVLKDAASTAFYGMRGANGVIVITTRQQ